jgi:hypothetical protein
MFLVIMELLVLVLVQKMHSMTAVIEAYSEHSSMHRSNKYMVRPGIVTHGSQLLLKTAARRTRSCIDIGPRKTEQHAEVRATNNADKNL